MRSGGEGNAILEANEGGFYEFGPQFFGFRCSTKGLFGVREMFHIYQGLSILCYELSKKKNSYD